MNWSQSSVEKVARTICWNAAIDSDDVPEDQAYIENEDEVAKAVLSVIAELPEVRGQWQPIETAPKEITKILAYDGNEIEVIHWGENWCSHGCYVPTHWMPLPPAPTK